MTKKVIRNKILKVISYDSKCQAVNSPDWCTALLQISENESREKKMVCCALCVHTIVYLNPYTWLHWKQITYQRVMNKMWTCRKKYYQDLTLQKLSASNWVYITELTSFQNAGGCDNKLLTSFMKVINK